MSTSFQRNAMAVVAVVAVLLAVMAGMAAAQTTSMPTCVSGLLPCATYLNGTVHPPDTCCKPLKKAVDDELPCLCSLFNNTELLKTFNVDVAQALKLPVRCNISTTSPNPQNICSKVSASPGSSSAGASPSSAKPAPPGGDNKSNAAFKLGWVGKSAFMGFLLFWWSIIAYY